MPIWILYLHDSRGISLAQILVLDALFEIMMLLSEVPTGVVADRWGRRQSMILGQVGVSVAVVLFAIAPNFWAVLGCYAVWAVSGALTSGSDIAFVHDSLEAQGRPGEFQRVVARGSAWAIAGMGISSILGAPIAALTSLHTAVVLSIGCAVASIPVVWRFHDPGTHRPAGDARYVTLLRVAARRVVHNHRLRTLIALQDIFSVAATLIIAQVFLDEHGLPLRWFGVVLAGLHLLAFTSAMMAPRVIGLAGRQAVIFAGAPVMVIAIALLGVMPLWGGVAMYAVLRVVLNVVAPVLTEQINHESANEVRATIASMGTMCISLVGAAAKPLMGWSSDANGLGSAYLLAAAGMLIFGGALSWTRVSRGRPSAAGCARTCLIGATSGSWRCDPSPTRSGHGSVLRQARPVHRQAMRVASRPRTVQVARPRREKGTREGARATPGACRGRRPGSRARSNRFARPSRALLVDHSPGRRGHARRAPGRCGSVRLAGPAQPRSRGRYAGRSAEGGGPPGNGDERRPTA
jgi:MFS family permease